MALRKWQSQCLDRLLEKYLRGQNHCLVTATPGAGKTYLTAELTKVLFEKELIDFVICIVPSVDVGNSFRIELAKSTNKRMDGRLGSFGETRTYHSLTHLDDEFWTVLDNKVFIIFDEIHHCAGDTPASCNTWGFSLLKHIKNRATFTLALTGTPWRTDQLPITLNKYCKELGMLSCDYTYSLAEAIKDKVCRTPQISTIDNNHFYYKHRNGDSKNYSSIAELLDAGVTFQELLENETLAIFILGCGVIKLEELRKLDPNAAGLVVASSIDHANRLAGLLKKYHNQDSVVVTSDDHNAHNVISAFRNDSTRWVISVSMISEGTNIPRLQVCCYMTNVRTELYIRQVLGRILRTTNSLSNYAYLYMLAEPNLVKYAQRISDDIPFDNIVINQSFRELSPGHPPIDNLHNDSTSDNEFEDEERVSNVLDQGNLEVDSRVNIDEDFESTSKPFLSNRVSIYGAFLEQLIKLEKSFAIAS